jgi:hypothetical protein
VLIEARSDVIVAGIEGQSDFGCSGLFVFVQDEHLRAVNGDMKEIVRGSLFRMQCHIVLSF